MNKFNKLLRGGEELWRVYPRHGVWYFWYWFFGCGLLIIDFFLLWPLFQLGQWGVLGFFLLLLIAAYFWIKGISLWKGNVMVLTSERILDIGTTSLFSTSVSQLNYQDIQDVSFSKKGIWALFFKFGTVQLMGNGGALHLVFPGLPEAEQVTEFIASVVKKTKQAPPFEIKEISTAPSLSTAERKKAVKDLFVDDL